VHLIGIDFQEAGKIIRPDDHGCSHCAQLGIEPLEDARKIRVFFS
jgi:hypothetical protein